MQPTTSDLIFQYLEKHPHSPPRELARALNLTITDVRYHLKHLTAAGLVEQVCIESSVTRGRPAALFRVTPACQPAAMLALTGHLLPLLAEKDLAAFAAGMIPCEITAQSSMVVRISRFVQYLNTLGYEARWEPRPSMPVVEFRRCPFAALRSEHPICCELDRIQLVLAAVCRVTRLERNACSFQLHPDEAA
jgi:predicted ArsR family transcriptional regulator